MLGMKIKERESMRLKDGESMIKYVKSVNYFQPWRRERRLSGVSMAVKLIIFVRFKKQFFGKASFLTI